MMEAPARRHFARPFAAPTTLLIAALLLASCATPRSSGIVASESPPVVPPAPPLSSTISWTGDAVSLSALAGRPVLLYFYRLSNVNSLRAADTLGRLMDRFGDEVSVILLHAGKYSAAKEEEHADYAYRTVEAILGDRMEAIAGFGMDVFLATFRDYNITAWPAFAIIGPSGRYLGAVGGEGNYRMVEEALMTAGASPQSPEPASPESAPAGPARDGFQLPSKAAFAGEYLYVSDPGAHRVVQIDWGRREVVAVYGSGVPGLQDGSGRQSRFHFPQGLESVGGRILVADALNDAVRVIEPESGRVSTLAGGPDDARRALRSPWDLAWRNGVLVVAVAAGHQLLVMDPEGGASLIYTGTGRLGLQDGTPPVAFLAQPMGLAFSPDALFFVDSDSSSVRRLPLAGGGIVETLAGRSVAEFGLRDGPGSEALLQFPTGIGYDEVVYVADTYNDVIRTLDVETGTLRTLVGPDRGLFRPGDVLPLGDELLIVDAGNRRLVLYHLGEDRMETVVLDWSRLSGER